MKKRCMTAVLCAAMMLTACGSTADDGRELTKRVKPLEIEAIGGTPEFSDAQMQFAVSLMQKAAEEASGDILISPYLAAEAWLTAAIGSNAQTAEAFGGAEISALNGSFAGWRQTQTDFTEASALWISPGRKSSISRDLLRTYLGFSNTKVFTCEPKETLLQEWLRAETGGNFSGIGFSADKTQYLFCTASVSVRWNDPYSDNEVESKLFHCSDTEQQPVKFLSKLSDSAVSIDDDAVRGLRREFGGTKYWFLALMPKSGTPNALLGSLTAEQLTGYIRDGIPESLRTAIPLLTAEQTQDISALLPGTDMPVMQHLRAEIGQGTEEATFAMDFGSSAAKKLVTLDRPFVYFVIDRQYGLPLLAGTVTHLPQN